jgi:hypothetical protein
VKSLLIASAPRLLKTTIWRVMTETERRVRNQRVRWITTATLNTKKAAGIVATGTTIEGRREMMTVSMKKEANATPRAGRVDSVDSDSNGDESQKKTADYM